MPTLALEPVDAAVGPSDEVTATDDVRRGSPSRALERSLAQLGTYARYRRRDFKAFHVAPRLHSDER